MCPVVQIRLVRVWVICILSVQSCIKIPGHPVKGVASGLLVGQVLIKLVSEMEVSWCDVYPCDSDPMFVRCRGEGEVQ